MDGANGSFKMDRSELHERDDLYLYPATESRWDDETNNRTGNLTKIDYFYFYEKEQLTTLWILFFSIVLGNCSVLVALFYSKGRGNRFRYFMKHLAIADLSVGLVSVLTDIIWKFTVEWRAGNAVCKIVKFSQVIVYVALKQRRKLRLQIMRIDRTANSIICAENWVLYAQRRAYLEAKQLQSQPPECPSNLFKKNASETFFLTSNCNCCCCIIYSSCQSLCRMHFSKFFLRECIIILGSFSDKIFQTVVVTYSSTYVLVALTIDRYDAIRHPMNFSKSWKRAKMLIATAWLLSFLFSIPMVVLYEEKSIEGHPQCWIDLLEGWHWQIYMILISVTVFFIPACIIATCYSIIIYTIWSKTNILSKSHMNHFSFTEMSNSQTEDTECQRVSSRGLIPRAKIKTIKMTLIIVFVFIFCWSPYMIFDLLQVFGYIERTQSNIALATFIQSLAPLNSAANPIIYCLFSSYMCSVPRKCPPLDHLRKWCSESRLGGGRKISCAVTFSEVTHDSTDRGKLENLSGVSKKIRHSSGKALEI